MNNNNKKIKSGIFQHWQLIAIYLVIIDIIIVNFSYFLGLWLRFDLIFSHIPQVYLQPYLHYAPVYTVICIAIFWIFHLYNSLWVYASFVELNRLILANFFTIIAQVVGITVFFQRMPMSYYMIGATMQFLLMTAVRFSYRYVKMFRNRQMTGNNAEHRAMIIGAGEAGRTIVRELNNTAKSDTIPVCFIDDNPNKWRRSMEGVPIVGGRDDILLNVEKYDVDRIMLCIPSASAHDKRDILNICKNTDCELQSLPSLYQLASGEVSISKMKPVAIEDLLGRDQVTIDDEGIGRSIEGKVILVTGGGGSIGSELCRQVAKRNPKQLIIFDVYENNAYEIQQELKAKYGNVLNLVVLIGSVRDTRRLDMIFRQYHPDIIYHAAAHKHVPLMEDSPNEAIKNNAVGTYKTAYMALKYHAEKFVLISTDKAVNPTNIMGASKRLCEMIIQAMNRIADSGEEKKLPLLHAHMTDDYEESVQLHSQAENHYDSKNDDFRKIKESKDSEHFESKNYDSMNTQESRNAEHFESKDIDGSNDINRSRIKTKDTDGKAISTSQDKTHIAHTQFAAVRFGNVLGSNGSVIPLFRKQIEKGGPVTVTHPDIIRYFMTIPEAVSLVMEAGTYAKGGEIFVLDMGEPVKIADLARNLIKLSGYTPDEDIKIVYTGLRPGEKLYEERLRDEEGLERTANKLINIGKPIPFDTDEFLSKFEELAKASYENVPDIVERVEDIVDTFHPVGQHPTGEGIKINM